MLPRVYNICQRNVNPCAIVASKFCTYAEVPTYVKIERDDNKHLQNLEEAQTKPKIQIITCKRKKYNYHRGLTFPKFKPLPLASEAWRFPKARGDYFTIHPIKEEIQESEKMKEITFTGLGLSDKLIANLENNLQISAPTTIQKKAIPVILDQHNVKLLAETGCGKTLAYLLPLVDQVLIWKQAFDRPFNHPLALIITPSRELALQIGRATMYLTKDLNLRTKVILSGGMKGRIFNPPASEVDIIVGTIGAVSKHTTVGIYKMKYVRHVVLDEADSLFDDTFYEKLRHFLKKISFGPLKELKDGLPRFSQLTLVSATMPQFIDEVLENIVDPSSLEEVATDKVHRVYVTQKFLRVGVQQKPMTLLKLIKSKANNRIPVMVFCNNSETCDWVSRFLNEFNVRSIRLNGKMTPLERKNKFTEFQTGLYNVLCTTDAGARGLDTIFVKDVINYDFPLQTSEYIHRCGRTARVGSPKNCRVINFIARPLEILLTQKIEKAVKMDKPLPMCDYLKRNWTEDVKDEKMQQSREKQNEDFEYSSKDSDELSGNSDEDSASEDEDTGGGKRKFSSNIKYCK